jgi:hypothetical protein
LQTITGNDQGSNFVVASNEVVAIPTRLQAAENVVEGKRDDPREAPLPVISRRKTNAPIPARNPI